MPSRWLHGQSLVEFALTAPLWLLWLLVSIQLALVILQYYSLMNVTRDTARWVAINQDTVDSAVFAYAQSKPLTLTPARITSVVTNPSCTALSGGLCANRLAGGIITVTITYDMANWIFLPTNYNIGGLSVTIPTTLPPYSVSVMIE